MNQVTQRGLRIVKSSFALSAAVGLGWVIARLVLLYLGDYVWRVIDEYEVGTLLAIGGIFLLILKDVLFALQKTWSYIVGGRASGPTLSEASVWVIEAMVATAILTVVSGAPDKECPNDWESCKKEADALSRSCFLVCFFEREVDYLTKHITQSKKEILDDHKIATLKGIALTPLLFENARTDGEDGLSEDSHGVAVQPDHRDQMRRIAKTLQTACPTRNVTLRTVGSPSLAPFRGKTEDESRELNLALANLRAGTAAHAMHQAIVSAGLGNVRIGTCEWEKFDDIQRSAFPGVDHLALKDTQHQARSAFIEVVDPPSCFAQSEPVKRKHICPKGSTWKPVQR